MDSKGKERGILKLEPRPRVIIDTSYRYELTPQGSCEHGPSSPQPSVDRLSVTWADPGSMTSSGVNLFHLPSETPVSNEVKFSPSAGDGSEDEDYSASLSAVLRQRRASVRRSRKGRARRPSSPFLTDENRPRRRSSVFTTSSGDTAISIEESPAIVTQEQIFENIHLHKEVLGSVKQQPLGMRRKLKIVHQAKGYIKRHEGQLQERLAQSKSTRDIYARFNILMAAKWQQLKREAANTSNLLIPWELRIKEIESHFGSVVASYFTFLRWLFWVNLVIGFILLVFVIVPEYLTANPNQDGGRKLIMEDELANATNLLTLWEFEGILKFSPIFYGYYSNIERVKYRMPLAYFLTGLVVYIYSFVAILRKMAENSRMSKLSEKEDECIFSWKLFTGWDFMIGNTETAHNRIASVILGFKEALLEEAEKKKDLRNWRIISLRAVVNICVMILLAVSASAVVLVVSRTEDSTKVRSWWRENETTIVVTVISIMFPVFFELLGFLEHYHPRKQLRLQLARIMLLNLLNLYSLIFALFSKIQGMSQELDTLKPNITMNVTEISNATLDLSQLLIPDCIEEIVPCGPCSLELALTSTESTSNKNSLNMQIYDVRVESLKMPKQNYDSNARNINNKDSLSTKLEKYEDKNTISTIDSIGDIELAKLRNIAQKNNIDSTYPVMSTNIDSIVNNELEKLRNLSKSIDGNSKYPVVKDVSTTIDSIGNNELEKLRNISKSIAVNARYPIDKDVSTTIDSIGNNELKKLRNISMSNVYSKKDKSSVVDDDDDDDDDSDYNFDNDTNITTDNYKDMFPSTDTDISYNNTTITKDAVSLENSIVTEETTQIFENTNTLVTNNINTNINDYTTNIADFSTKFVDTSYISNDISTFTTNNADVSSELPDTPPTNTDISTNTRYTSDNTDMTESSYAYTDKSTDMTDTTEFGTYTSDTNNDITEEIKLTKDTTEPYKISTIISISATDFTTVESTTSYFNTNAFSTKLYEYDESNVTTELNIPSTNFTKMYNELDTFQNKGLKCPNLSFNCSVMCAGRNITQVFNIVKCSQVKRVCYTKKCHNVGNATDLKKNLTNATAIDVVYIDDSNIKQYNLTPPTRKKLLKLCWETMFGQELVKLTMMDLVFVLLGTLFMDFFRALFVRYMNRCWCWDLEKKFPEYGDFKIAENILHLINNQGMVWMGMFFSPGLVVLNVVKLMIMMYLRSWAVMTCNVPHEVVFRVSKSNNFYLALLLTMLFLCVLPVGYTIVWVKPSWHCGPFSEYDRIYYILTNNIYKLLPASLNFTLKYISSPAIVIPLLVLLILIIYYLTSLTNSLREANNDLKIQLRRERTEERRKMFQLADTRRRAGSSAMDNTPFARWKKALPSLPLSKSIDSDDRKTSAADETVEPMKITKKKGGIFAKIVNMAVDKKSDVSATSDMPSPFSYNMDDETDTDFHETLPKEILKVKDITLSKNLEQKKKNSVEFKTDDDEKHKTKTERSHKLKLKGIDDETENKTGVVKQNRDVANVNKSKSFKVEEDAQVSNGNKKINEKQVSESSTQSRQSDSIGSVIPVIMISTTESDEEGLQIDRGKKDTKTKERKHKEYVRGSRAHNEDCEQKVKKSCSETKSLRRQSSVDSIKSQKTTKEYKSEEGHKYQYSL